MVAGFLALGLWVSSSFAAHTAAPIGLAAVLPDTPSEENPLTTALEIEFGEDKLSVSSARAAVVKQALNYISAYVQEHSSACLSSEKDRKIFAADAEIFSKITRFLAVLDSSVLHGPTPRLVLKTSAPLLKLRDDFDSYRRGKLSSFGIYGEIFEKEDRLLVRALDVLLETLFDQRVQFQNEKLNVAANIRELCQVKIKQDFLGPRVDPNEIEVFVEDPDGTRQLVTSQHLVTAKNYTHIFLRIPVTDSGSGVEEVKLIIRPDLGPAELVKQDENGVEFKIPLRKGITDTISLLSIRAKDRVGNWADSLKGLEAKKLFHLAGGHSDYIAPLASVEQVAILVEKEAGKKPVLVNTPEAAQALGKNVELPYVTPGNWVTLSFPVSDEGSGVARAIVELHKDGILEKVFMRPKPMVAFKFQVPSDASSGIYYWKVYVEDVAGNPKQYPKIPLIRVISTENPPGPKEIEATSFSLQVPNREEFLDPSNWNSLSPGSVVRLSFSLSNQEGVESVSVTMKKSEGVRGNSISSHRCEGVENRYVCAVPTSVFGSSHTLLKVNVVDHSGRLTQLDPKDLVFFSTEVIQNPLENHFRIESFSGDLTGDAQKLAQSWIADLDKDEYLDREEASLRLARSIDWVHPLLVTEWESTDDPELKWRLERILKTPFPSLFRVD